MITLVYEKRSEGYELASFCRNGGDDVRFIFELPINARLIIESTEYRIKDGLLKLPSSKLPDGEISPKLICGRGIQILSPLIVKSGIVIPAPYNTEDIIDIRALCEKLKRRLDHLEGELGKINKKITKTIEF